MIRLPDVPLSATALHQLEHWQGEVDAFASHPERVEAAKRHFSLRNTAKNKTFVEVRRALTAMCAGARRCGYCEDSAADEVEHIWPKDLYPEQVFAWSNYLYACGPCNGPKKPRSAGDLPLHARRREGLEGPPSMRRTPLSGRRCSGSTRCIPNCGASSARLPRRWAGRSRAAHRPGFRL